MRKKRLTKRALSFVLALALMITSMTAGLSVLAVEVREARAANALAQDYSSFGDPTLPHIAEVLEKIEERGIVDAIANGTYSSVTNEYGERIYNSGVAESANPGGTATNDLTINDTADRLLMDLAESYYFYQWEDKATGAKNKKGESGGSARMANRANQTATALIDGGYFDASDESWLRRMLYDVSSSGWNATDYTGVYRIFIRVPTEGKNYLLGYDTVNNIPNEGVLLESAYWFQVDRSGFITKTSYLTDYGRGGSKEGEALVYDQVSKGQLKAFEDVFTADVLSKEYEELTAAQRLNIYLNGTDVYNTVANGGYSTDVLDHFFGEGGFDKAKALIDQSNAEFFSKYVIEPISTANTQYPDADSMASMDITERQRIQSVLDNFLTYYNGLNGKLSGTQATQLTTAKGWYDRLTSDLEGSRWVPYNNAVYALGQLIMTESLVQAINGTSVDDNLAGVVAQAAQYYADAAAGLELAGGSSYNSWSAVRDAVKGSLKKDKPADGGMGTEDAPGSGQQNYEKYGAEAIIDWISANQQSGTFTVTQNPLLHDWHSIAEIPESFTWKVTVFTYGSVPTVNVSVTENTDTTAKANFTAFQNFYDNISDFRKMDATQLAELYAQALEANKKIESYTQAQCKNILGEDYMAVFNDLSAWMAEIFKATAEKLYNTYNDKELTREDIAAMADDIFGTEKIYNNLTEEQKQDPDVVTAKTYYDEIRSKYDEAVKNFARIDYNAAIQELAELVQKDAVQALTGSAARDNAAGDIKAAADKYLEVAGYCYTMDPATYGNVSAVNAQITLDVQAITGQNVKIADALRYIGSGTFTLTPEYLKDIASVDQIPQSLSYTQYTYTFTDVANPVMTEQAMTDTAASKAFGDYAALFGAAGAQAPTVEELVAYGSDRVIALRDSMQSVKEALANYNTATDIKDRLLGDSDARQQRELQTATNIDLAIAQLFVDGVNAAHNTYWNDAQGKYVFVREGVNAAIDEFSALASLYELVSNKSAADVVEAYAKLQAMINALNAFLTEDNLTKFREAVASMADQFFNGTSLKVTIDKSNVTQAQDAVTKVLNAWNALTNDQKNLGEVTAEVTKSYDSESNTWGDLTGGRVKTLQDAINAVTGFDTSAQYPTKPWADIPNISYSLPAGVTESDITNLLSNLDNLLKEDFVKELLGGQTLKEYLLDMIGEQLYTDTVLNTLLQTVYPMLQSAIQQAYNDNSGVINALLFFNGREQSFQGLQNFLDIHLDPVDLADQTSTANGHAYPEVEAEMRRANLDWNQVNWDNVKWGINGDRNAFVKALGVSLINLFPVLKTILLNYSMYSGALTFFNAGNGYDNVIRPLMQHLGCKNILSAESMDEIARISGNNQAAIPIFEKILNPILDRVEEILENPVTELTNLLPLIGYMANNNILQKGLNELIYPITHTGIVGGIIGGSLDVNSMLDLSNLNALIEDLLGTLLGTITAAAASEIGGVEIPAKQVSFTYQPIDWYTLSGLATQNKNVPDPDKKQGAVVGIRMSITADTPKVGAFLLRYLVNTIKANQDLLVHMTGMEEGSAVHNILSNLFAKDADTIISKLFEVIKNPENSDVDWSQYQNLAGVFDWGTDGLNQDQTDQVIAQLSALLQYVLGDVTGGDVAAFLDSIYTDEMVSQLVTTLYGALGSNSTVPLIFLAMGFNVSKDNVAAALADNYPDIAAVINNAADWSQVDLTGADWGINSATGSTTAKADAFMDAVSTALRPFYPLLKALLLGGPGGAEGIDLLGITTIHGANGYANGIYPLLVALGCDAMTPDEYKTAVEQNESNLISAIVEPVLNKLASLTADPLTVVLDMLPNFANFLANGGLTKALMGFLKPVTNIVTPLLSLAMTNSATADTVSAEQALNWVMGFVLGTDGQPGLIQLPDSVEISEGFSLDLTKLNLTALDFGDLEGSVVTILKSALAGGLLVINGQPFSLTLKDIDWTKLAAASESYTDLGSGLGSLAGNPAESFVTLLRWLIDTVRVDSNLTSVKTLIMGLTGTQDETITDILNQVFANLSETNTDLSTDRIIKILFELLSPQDPADTLDLIYKELGVSDVTDGDVTFENYEEVITVFDNLINAIMNQIVGSDDLNTMVSGMLYTDANLTAIAQGLYNALGGVSGIDTILNLVGVDVTPAALSTALAAYAGADQIANAASLAEIDWTAVQWNTNGDREAFVSALAAILSPFNAVLKVLLIGEDLNVALEGTDIITIMGGNGYDTAVIPLLEALGCQNIKSEADYIAAVEADDTALLTEIINPVLSLLENVLKSPVDSLATMLPNIAYFLSNGNLSVVVQNLLAPVMKLIDLVDPLIDVDALLGQLIGSLLGVEGIDSLFGMLEDIDLASLINPILKNILPAELQLTLPEIDLAQLAACGTLEEFTSQSTVGVTGDFDVAQYDRANKGQVLKAVFLYIMEAAQANKDTITNYINSLLADADQMLKDIANTAVNNLLTGDANQIADALVTLLVLMKENDYPYATYQYDKFTQTTPDYGNLTAEDYEAAIETLDNLVENLLANLMDGQTLEELIGTNVYTNANVNALVGALYPALGNIEGVNLTEIFGYLGMTVDVTPNGLATALGSDYADVAAALTGKASWNEVTVDSLNWNVTDAASFVNALSAALRPFNPLLKVLLMGESITALNSVTIEGSNGYNNAVIPLLEALGCEDLTTAAEIKGSSDPDALLKAILTPIAGLIEKVSTAPVDTVASILPNIAYFIDNGNLETAVRNLAAPVLKIVEVLKPVVDVDALLGQLLPGVVEQNPIVGQILGTTYTVDAILGKLGSLDLDEIGNAVLAGITLPEVNGVQLNLKLADINLSELAGRGTLESYDTAMAAFGSNDPANAKHVVADKASVLSGVATYLVELIRTEPNATTVKNLLTSLIGDVEIVNEIIDRVLSEEVPATDLLEIVIVLLSGLTQDDYPYATYQYDKFTQTTPDYGNLTAEDYEAAIETLDNLVENLLANLMDGQTLEELIGTNVYTNANVNALVGALYPALGNIEGVNLTEIFGYLGMTVDVTPNGLATALGSDYADVAAALTGKASWNEVTVDSLNWNVTDAASFVNALSAALRPFNPLLKVLLMGESITALNSVTIEGSNGYNNAVIPVLEALGCEDLTAAAEIKGSSDPDALLKAILTPIAGLIEKVSTAPVDTVASILPNIAYFIDNGNLETAVRNLAAPVLKIVEVLKPVVDVDALLGQLLPGVVEQNPIVGQILGTTYTVDAILGKLGSLDLDEIGNAVLAGITLPEVNGVQLNLKLADINLSELAGRGTLESYDTAMAAFGSNDPANAKHVVADKASVLSGVATYLVELIRTEPNATTVKNLLTSLIGDVEIVNEIIDRVLSNEVPATDLLEIVIVLLSGLTQDDYPYATYQYDKFTQTTPDYGNLTAEDYEAAIETLDNLVENLLANLMDGQTLEELIGTNVYTNANVNALVGALYPALGNIEGVNLTEIFGYLGMTVDVTPNGLATALGSDYADVAAALTGKASWNEVTVDSLNWNVTDAASFVNALSAALRPFNPLLKVLLMGESITALNSVTIEGSNGYNNAVIPVLEALGCEDLTAAAEIKGSSDPDALLKAILTPIAGLIEKVSTAPVDTVASILPNIAYFIDNGNLETAVRNLAAPVLKIVEVLKPVVDVDALLGQLLPGVVEQNPIVGQILGTTYTVDAILGKLGNIDLNQIISVVLANVDLGVTLTLPQISLTQLAGRGTLEGYDTAMAAFGDNNPANAKHVVADKASVLSGIAAYLVETVSVNRDAISDMLKDLLGDSDLVNSILTQVLDSMENPADLIGALVLILTGRYNVNFYGYSFPNITPAGENFGRFDRETFEQALAAFDPFISTILGGLLGMSGGIGGMINSAIYTNANVTALVTALYPALENIEGVNLTEIFGYLGLDMDLTPAGFANALGGDYANVTAALNGKTSWADVDLTNVSWGFTDGDATGFVNALSAALRPFNPLLNVLLMDGSLNVMDSVTIQGGNGYNTAVIPLLEALGCENITPAAEVKASSDPDALLKAILTPITGLVARVGSAPIETLTDILPNIAYFIDNGNLKAALQNLLAPVLALVDVVDPAVLDVNSLVGDLLTPLLTPVLGEGDYTLDGLFDLVGNIGDKLVPILNQVLTFNVNGAQITLKLSDLDFGKLAAMGAVVDYSSAAVVNGSQMAAKRIDADQPAVLYAVMYYLVDTLKIPENMSAIEGLLGGNEMISGILGSLLGGTNDDAIAVILSLLGIGDDGSQPPTPGGDNEDPSFGDGSEPGFEGGFTPGFDGGFDSGFDSGSGFVDDAFAEGETGASTDETTPSDQNGGEDQSGEGDGDNKMSPVVLGVCIGLGILLLLLIISLIIVGVVKKKKKEKENAPQNTETPEQK